jgi:histidinol phosphatase-like PHP family hydrolase
MRSRNLTNSDIAELLAREAESASYPLQRALRRAGRSAFLWHESAVELVRLDKPLTELHGVGPFLEKTIRDWVRKAPEVPKRDPLRKNFLSWTEAQQILEKAPEFRKKVRGDLQMHTEWSDGSGTIRAMAEAGMERNYEYIAITDHGKRLKIAGGMNELELEEQHAEITSINRELSKEGKAFRVLHSIELNLDTEGQGDMTSKSLAKLDLVVAAFHSSLRKTEDQTERYLAALRNPDVHILAHPRGRIYNYRMGLKADWSRVFAVAAQLNKAVEIDCYPDRQDLSLDLLKLARKAGVRISLGTDSHHPWQLEFIDFGLATAVAAKISPDHILNFMGATELLGWAASLRRSAPV